MNKFIAGILCAMMGGIGGWHVAKIPSSNVIGECQKELPRNEVCVLQAVSQLTTNKETK